MEITDHHKLVDRHWLLRWVRRQQKILVITIICNITGRPWRLHISNLSLQSFTLLSSAFIQNSVLNTKQFDSKQNHNMWKSVFIYKICYLQI